MLYYQELPKYMTQEEVTNFLKVIKDKRDKALFLLIYKYGLRISEAVKLNLKSVDLKHSKLHIVRAKGGISGERPLFPDVKRILNLYLKERTNNSEALFTGRQGRLKERAIQHLFRTYAKKAKLKDDFHTHSLRHSIAVHLLDAGQDLFFVKDHLGHKNIQNTQIYAQISSPTRKRIFEDLAYSPNIVSI